MTGDVIKSFLVGLGFDVDDTSLAKFNRAVSSAALKVTALYASVKIAGTGILYGLSKISEGFEQMGYEYRLIAPAINKTLQLRQEMLKAYSAAGVNIYKVIQASVKLNFSLAKTRFAFEALYKSVASRFFDTLTKQSDSFRKTIYANMPKIQNFLEKFIKFMFKALEATTALGLRLWGILTRVYDFFVMLDKATDGWSTRIVAVIAAWKLLNLSFLATPLGMILAGFVALLALWDDFKTFKEGGNSLIDWGSDATKTMVGLAAAVGGVALAIGAVVLAIKAYTLAQGIANGVAAAFSAILSLNPIGLVIIALTTLVGLLTLADAKWKIFGGNVAGFFSGVGSKIMDFVGGPTVGANLQNSPGGVPSVSPVGPNVQNAQNNQHVQQQTNINVIGSADAGAVGKAVSSEQSRVNFDMVRNMKGATR